MGAGRRTWTTRLDSSACSGDSGSWEYSSSSNSRPWMRGLSKRDLGGVLFHCSSDTYGECIRLGLFGMPRAHWEYVQNIEAGLPLFLFNNTDRSLHGVFRASGSADYNLNPAAWSAPNASMSRFPAQVPVVLEDPCQPLAETVFKSAIAQNYEGRRFYNEVDHEQARRLIRLFRSNPAAPRPTMQLAARAPLAAAQVAAAPAPVAAPPAPVASPPARVTSPAPVVASVPARVAFPAPVVASVPARVASTAAAPMPARAASPVAVAAPMPATYPVAAASPLEAAASVDFSADENNSSASDSSSEDDAPAAANTVTGQDTPASSEEFFQEMMVELGLVHAAPATQAEYPARCQDVVEPGDKELEAMNGRLQVLKALSLQRQEEIRQREEGIRKREEEVRALEEEMQVLEDEREVLNGELQELKRSLEQQEAIIRSWEEQGRKRSIYIIGGFTGSCRLSSVDILEPKQERQEKNRLRKAPPLLSPRSCAASAVLGGDIYVMGGMSSESWVSTMEKLSCDACEWRRCEVMSVARGMLAAVSARDRVYAIGGRDDAKLYATVECYNPETGSWLPSVDLSEARCSVAAVTSTEDGAIYAFGGTGQEHAVATAERLDAREARWQRLPDMSVRRTWLSAAELRGRVYAIGGTDGKQVVGSVEVFDARAGRWEVACPLPAARAHASAVSLQGAVYLIGGQDAERRYLGTVERYRPTAAAPAAGHWETLLFESPMEAAPTLTRCVACLATV